MKRASFFPFGSLPPSLSVSTLLMGSQKKKREAKKETLKTTFLPCGNLKLKIIHNNRQFSLKPIFFFA